MKLAGFLMLLAGWGIALTAIAVLPGSAARAVFLLAGMGIEIVGLALVIRSHIPAREQKP